MTKTNGHKIESAEWLAILLEGHDGGYHGDDVSGHWESVGCTECARNRTIRYAAAAHGRGVLADRDTRLASQERWRQALADAHNEGAHGHDESGYWALVAGCDACQWNRARK